MTNHFTSLTTQKILRRAHLILEIAQRMAKDDWRIRNQIEEIQIHTEYGEPGYSSETGVIATGNWNEVDEYDPQLQMRVPISNLPKRIGEIFERMGIECEWSDEWSSCEDCGALVRTSGDSYCWQPSYAIIDECTFLCHKCILEDPVDYLEELVGDCNRCMTLEDLDLTQHGWKQYNADSYESGWHPGQNDSPQKIAKELKKMGIHRFIFKLDENSQFYSKWSVFIPNDDQEESDPNSYDYDDNDE